jgi:leucyl-tRNA synthetase
LIKFNVSQHSSIEVFTTRPDTIYGVTFLSVAPENPLVAQLTIPAQKKIVTAYINEAKTKTELQRKELLKDKSGVFTGSYAINPFTNEQIPIYVADYVLNSYATGMVMGVPGHDQRDYDFALKYKLPIKYVIASNDNTQAFEGDGEHINSDLINGLHIEDGSQAIIKYITEHKIGKKIITYKMKD